MSNVLKMGITAIVIILLFGSSVAFGENSKFKPDEAVLTAYQNLSGLVNNSALGRGTKTDLLASLTSSRAWYVKGSFISAVKDLDAFKGIVTAQVKDKPQKNNQAPVPGPMSELASLLTSGANNLQTSIEMNYLTFVKIGVTENNGLDPSTQAIVKLASEDVNSYARSIKSSFRFSFVILDNEGSPDKALANTKIFHESGINLVVGHGWSTMCQACLPYINDPSINMLLFSQSSTYPLQELTQRDNLFRLVPNDGVQGNVIVDAYSQLKINKVLILYSEDAYGQGIKNVIVDDCAKKSSPVKVLAAEGYNLDNPDLMTHLSSLEKVLPANTQGVALQLVTYSDVNEILSARGGYLQGIQPTDASGTTTITNLATGTYNIAVGWSSNYGIAAQNIEVVQGQTSSADFTLYPQGFITGTVKHSNGDPVANNYVDTSTPSSQFGYSGQTDSNGAFTIGYLVPGVYTVRVLLPSGNWFEYAGVNVEAGKTTSGVEIVIP